MALDPLGWALGYAATKSADVLLRESASKKLRKDLREAVEDWTSDLPRGAEIDPATLFPPPTSPIYLEDDPSVAAVRDGLRDERIPSNAQWTEALLAQWKAVRDKTDESTLTGFFRLAEGEATELLSGLATRLARVCRKHDGFFRSEVHGMLQRILAHVEGPQAQASTSAPSSEDSRIADAQTLLESNDPHSALGVLDRIRTASWGDLSPDQKYQVEAMTGHAHSRLGDPDAAAAGYIAGLEHKPESSRARALASYGYYLRGDSAKARKLASQVIHDSPDNATAHSVCISAAAPNESLQELESQVPQALRQDAEIAIALASKALERRDNTRAEVHGRAALRTKPDSRDTKELVAIAILDEQILRRATGKEHPDVAGSEARAKESRTSIHRGNRGAARRQQGKGCTLAKARRCARTIW